MLPHQFSRLDIFIKFVFVLTLVGTYANQAPHNITMAIAVVFCVIYLFTVKAQLRQFFGQFKYFYLCLCLYFLFYIAINAYHFGLKDDFYYALQRIRWVLYLLIVLPVFTIFLADRWVKSRAYIRYIFLFFGLIVSMSVIDSFLRFFLETTWLIDFFGTSDFDVKRPGWIYNPILFSKISFFSSLIFFLLYYLSSSKAIKFAALLVAIGALSACILTQVRGAWLAIILLLFLSCLFISRLRLLSVVVLLSTSAAFLVFPDSEFSERAKAAISMSNYSEQYRIQQWKANIQLVVNNPFGVGYAANRKPEVLSEYLPKDFDVGQPHNEYVDILAAVGFLGLLLFLLVLLIPFY